MRWELATLGIRPGPVRRAPAGAPDERRIISPDGTIVSFSTARSSWDRVDPADADGDGVPDVVAAIASGIDAARKVAVEELGLPKPPALTVVLSRLPAGFDGVAIAEPQGTWTVVLDARPGTSAATVTRAAAHHVAHVALVASGVALPSPWVEAFAGWVELRAVGADGALLERLRERRARLHDGLAPHDPATLAGNALWLSFLSEAYGTSAVRIGLEELAAGGEGLPVWDRVLRRAAGTGLPEALRELHVWSILTGSRDDGRHWSFASLLGDPTFVAHADWLPVLSVRADPAVAPGGLVSAAIRPDGVSGGLTVRFEGDFGGSWSADVLLSFRDGTLHRVPLDLDASGSGEVTVPLDGLVDAVLLVRNVAADGPARRFTWSAFREPGFPVEFEDAAVDVSAEPGQVAVSWTTLAEWRVVGFSLWRKLADGGERVRVNPVRVPAIGGPGQPASYRFVDRDATPGRTYVYTVEAVTVEGLGSRSRPSAPVRVPER